MEQESLKRKERLQALRKAKEQSNNITTTTNASSLPSSQAETIQNNKRPAQDEKPLSHTTGSVHNNTTSKSSSLASSSSLESKNIQTTTATLSFRNYKPGSSELTDQSMMITSGDLNKIKDSLKKVEKDIELFAQNAIDLEKQRQSEELDLLNIAPKKPNWDLKRNLEKKLQVVEEQTQLCIAELIRDRLKSQQNISDGSWFY